MEQTGQLNTRQEYAEAIESWLKQYDDTVEKIKKKEALPPSDLYAEKLNELQSLHEDILATLEKVKTADDDSWDSLKPQVDDMMKTGDKAFKQSLAYFH